MFMEKLYGLYKALGFRTLWVLDDVMRSFRRIASESAYGVGRLNGAVQLTDVFQNMKDIKSKAVTCFSINPYSTDIQKWSFDKTNNKAVSCYFPVISQCDHFAKYSQTPLYKHLIRLIYRFSQG